MSEGRLGLYVHIPFCRAKCRYCDFNSYAGVESLVPSYVDALLAEMLRWRPLVADFTVTTVFIGGGTPSILPPAEVKRVLGTVRDSFRPDGRAPARLAPDAEVSLEANPGTVDVAYLKGLRRLGVNRLSLGVQSLRDDDLRLLGRIHTAAEAREAYQAARRAGFDNVNIDLIYGLPWQTLRDWRRTLKEAIALRPDHLSLYALTLEEGTPLAADVSSGRVPQPDPDLAADMYREAEAALAAADYQHYEISNWALPGRRCRHNLTYWRNEPYLGLGTGAHSSFGGFRFANTRAPREYIRGVEESAAREPAADGIASFLASLAHIETSEETSRASAMAETVILGLRLVDGLPFEGFRRRFGLELTAAYGPQVEELEGFGLLERADGRLRLTPRGRLLGNEAFQRFLPA